MKSIVKDAESANIEGLKAVHLDSDKFTKFGPRSFDRQDVEAKKGSGRQTFVFLKTTNGWKIVHEHGTPR